MTAAGDKFCNIFLNFQKKGMIFHENRLSDDYHEISCFICYFCKKIKNLDCCALQIIGGALLVICMC